MSSDTTVTSRDWFKSSRSSDNAYCIEVRVAAEGVGVRDSKDRFGPILAFDPAAWSTFVTTLKATRS